MGHKEKIVSLKNISARLEPFRKQGKKIGFVEGIFDVVHLGHVELVEFVKKHSDIVVVGVASDAYARSSKGKNRPIFDQKIRARMMAALADTDFVLVEDNPPGDLGDKSQEEYLHKVTIILRPNVLVSSGTTDRNPNAKRKRAKEVGAKFIIQKASRPSKNSSTTQILALLGKK